MELFQPIVGCLASRNLGVRCQPLPQRVLRFQPVSCFGESFDSAPFLGRSAQDDISAVAAKHGRCDPFRTDPEPIPEDFRACGIDL